MTMLETTTAKAPRQRRKPARFCRVSRSEEGTRTLTLRVGKQATDYDLLEIGSDGGRGYELTKADRTVYHVNIDGLASCCCCKGFSRWGRCKHVDALAALVRTGRL